MSEIPLEDVEHYVSRVSFEVKVAYEMPHPRQEYETCEKILRRLCDVAHGCVFDEMDDACFYTSPRPDDIDARDLQQWVDRLVYEAEVRAKDERRKRHEAFREKMKSDPALREANDWSDV